MSILLDLSMSDCISSFIDILLGFIFEVSFLTKEVLFETILRVLIHNRFNYSCFLNWNVIF